MKLMSEVLIPLGGDERRGEAGGGWVKFLLGLTLLTTVGLGVFRYEQIICNLEMRVAALEGGVRVDRSSRGSQVVEERRKREVGVGLGIPPWVKRTGEGEPVLNEDYRHYVQRQEGRRSVGSELLRSGDAKESRRASSSRRNPVDIARRHEDETFSVGEEVRPSGLREIYDRLPPVSQEVGYETARPLETRSRDSAASQGQRSFPPVQRVGSGPDQVNARVVRYEDDVEDEEEESRRRGGVSVGGGGVNEAIAGHFVADVSNFTATENPRLRNSNGIFQIWRPSAWMSGRWFTLDKVDGTVTVQKGGLYQIYSQIHYHDEHEENSFVVEVGGEALLQCTTTRDSHSCYTGGVANLRGGEKVLIKNVGVDRFSIYKPEKSFFGLVRLGDAPPV